MLAVAVAATVALAGCGGDGEARGGEGAAAGPVNTFEGRTPAEILATAKSAAQQASSVHMTGSFDEGGARMAFDLVLSDGRGGQGSITIDGDEMAIRQVGDAVYVKGSEEVWAAMVPGTAEVASRLDGTWVRIGRDDAAAARFTEITSIDRAFEGLLRPADRSLAKVAGKDVGGVPTVGLLDRADSGEPATLYVAARGPAYPLLVEPKQGSGRVSFTEWNRQVTVQRPAGKTVDLAKVVGT
jgi:hypothetical protein